MGLFGFSGETYYYGASKAVTLFEPPKKSFLSLTVQRAIINNRDIVDSILHSVGSNFGAYLSDFIDYSKDKNGFWHNTTGLYTTMEEQMLFELNKFPYWYEGDPLAHTVTDFRIESHITSNGEITDKYVLSQLQHVYGLIPITSEIDGPTLTGNQTDLVGKYVGYNRGATYVEEETTGFFPVITYDQHYADFTVEFLVTDIYGAIRPFTKVYKWRYSEDLRIPYCRYLRGTLNLPYTYVSTYSEAPTWTGWDSVGDFNNIGQWEVEAKTQRELDKGRYFIDPAPITVLGERITSDSYWGGVEPALELIGLDYDTLYDSVMDVQNNDYTLQILSAEVEFSVFVNDQRSVIGKFLWLTFWEARKYAFTSYERFEKIKNGTITETNVAQSGNLLGANIYFNSIRYETGFTKTIGTVGTYLTEVVIKPPINITIGSDVVEFEDSDLVIWKQTAVGVCEKMTVNGLYRSNKYYSQGNNVNQRTVKTLASTTAFDASTVSGREDEGLRVPVHTYIWNKLSPSEKEELGLACVALHMQVEKSEYLEWYKTQGFIDVVQIILVAVSIYTAGTSSWLNGIVNASTLSAAALLVLEAIFVAVAVNELFALAIDLLGERFGLIAAFLAIVAAAYTGNTGFVLRIADFTFSTNLLQLATLTIQAVQEKIDEDLQDLLKEAQAWEEESDAREQELLGIKELYDDLDSGQSLVATSYQGFYFNPFESPTSFFDRTTRLTNVADMALSFPSTFVEDALNLDNINYLGA